MAKQRRFPLRSLRAQTRTGSPAGSKVSVGTMFRLQRCFGIGGTGSPRLPPPGESYACILYLHMFNIRNHISYHIISCHIYILEVRHLERVNARACARRALLNVQMHAYTRTLAHMHTCMHARMHTCAHPDMTVT